MLNPIKSFFNYLQKNAHSSNIFKSPTDLSMSDEVNSSPEGVEVESFEDPLTDPLAIDDDFNANYGAEKVLEVSSETESASIDKIIFVDIEKLKSAKELIEEPECSTKSDINGNNRNSLEIKESSSENTSDVQTIVEVQEEPPDNKSENDLNSVEPSVEPEKEVLSAESSFVISVHNSEPEIDDVADTSALLEELRSDGSDSGLGSDSLRSISAIEKNLATLTPSKSSLKRRSVDNLHDDQAKKPKRGINFGDVTVFYFPRCQGFGCVPTVGGSTLGMTAKHAYKKSFSLIEHAIEQRRLHRLKMAGNEMNGSSSSSDESKSEDETSEISLSDGDSEAYGFLQPVTARQRRALLKSAGVRKIDAAEKDECRLLRTSREVCGCTCRGYCDPDTCECSQAGIKCQVDRLKPHEFPCGCTRDGCGNVNGRIEFNPARVKTHFIHTIMKLELEKRQEMSEDATTSVIQNHSKWWSQMRMQQSQASTSCSYGSYPYNSAMSVVTPQYPAKIPPISAMVTPTTVIGQESLDLHYAYRDEYNASSLSLNAEHPGSSYSSPATSNDYYGSYNYMQVSSPSNNPYQNGYAPIQHQPQPQQSQSANVSYQNPCQTQIQPIYQSSDCQYSNYTPTNGSNRFHSRADSAIDMNGFVNNYPTSLHNGSPTNHSRNNYQVAVVQQSNQESLNPIDNFSTITPTTIKSTSTITNTNNNNIVSNFTENSGAASESSTENLSDIIKKSIVETVTA